MLRSSIRATDGCDAKAATTTTRYATSGSDAAANTRPRRQPESEQRRERHDPEIEVELCDVVEDVAQHRAGGVVAVGRGAVGPEQRQGRAATRDRRDDCGRGAAGE